MDNVLTAMTQITPEQVKRLEKLADDCDACPAGGLALGEPRELGEAIRTALAELAALTAPGDETNHGAAPALGGLNDSGDTPAPVTPAQPHGAPGEWVMVPREATNQQIDAAIYQDSRWGVGSVERLRRAYCAMISSAPPIPRGPND